MKLKTLALSALSAPLALLATLPVGAPAFAAGAVTAQNAWVRWLPNKLPAAGYLTLVNAGDKPLDLVDVDSPDYGMAMLHRTVSNGSTRKMEMVDKVTIPAHGRLDVAPGGYHFMLEEPRHAIKPGDTVHLRLKFSDGETLDTPFAVKPPGQAN